ncbi:hypothetical protein HGRIS_003744 [Hohenbuehelia grisea]|uniref:Methyltransferase ausD n=1 Tax=Hohenbuehelia grisea TaxID=104357 RepID=A0ABR3JHC6_9AGAR
MSSEMWYSDSTQLRQLRNADPLAGKRPQLDPSFYNLEEDEADFFKTQTGIEDDEELKEHILAVQAKAYKIYGYPCIRRFAFLSLKISRLPAYPAVLQLGRERKGAILLDLGCCFGNDIRKAVVDGFPVEGAIASDLRQGFWDAGHELFKSTPASCPIKFIAGDVFDPAHIYRHSPFYEAPGLSCPSDLQQLTSLTPLLGHISAVHVSAFFHLFDEEKQLEIAKIVAGLLSPEPGSIIFGAHGGLPEKGLREPSIPGSTFRMFCHSPQSWCELWEGQVFRKGTVKAEARVVLIENLYMLEWSVTKL